MGVRTCQLCGKPLGRMRGDEEFCSREHRNQFQLRRGLDRLEEANKVANLMRRRETPRQIPTGQLAAAAAPQLRAVLEPARYPMRTAEAAFPPIAPALFRVKIAGRAGDFSNPASSLAVRPPSVQSRREISTSIAWVSGASASPALGALKVQKGSAAMAPARFVSVTQGVSATRNSPRDCDAMLQTARRPTLPRGGLTAATAGSGHLERTRRFQVLAASASASEGEARSAPVIEFQRRVPALRPHHRDIGHTGKRASERRADMTPPAVLDFPITPRLCAVPRVEIEAKLPRLRREPTVSGARRSGTIRLLPAMHGAAEVTSRACGVSWRVEGSVRGPGLRTAGFRLGTVGIGRSLPLPCARYVAGEVRPAEVRFVPAEASFDLAPIALHDAMNPGGGEAPRRGSEPVEENFNQGLDRWVGDTAAWRLDAAGARPGALALLRPTLELADYEFEFFTRIESQAVAFVFRAANASNYQRVTIAMVESGRYELQRCAVIGGVEEKAVASPLPGALRPGAAFTVKTRASQNDFTVWLDGELAARWTDGRLPAGGIGFMAPRDSRARVYWVRLSPADGLNSRAAQDRQVRSIQ